MNLVDQIKDKARKAGRMKRTKQLDGSTETMISTGSTLLDLAITGGRVRGGGIPGGILVEIFGPAGTGKTVLLCEIAGGVKRQRGEVMFRDPEARLNKQFAKLFGLDLDQVEYDTPQTVPEVFKPVRKWEPEPEGSIHGIFADSLAALSTDQELDDNDPYGMKRAKEFSEELRKTCRTLTQKNFLMVASNQMRQNLDAGQFGQKYKSPGGEAIGFYSSLRLRLRKPKKDAQIRRVAKVAGKDLRRVVGVTSEVEVFKSSVWEPYRTAPVTILFDYGIDDIRENLKFIKTYTKATTYVVKGEKLSQSLDDSIAIIEEDKLERRLRREVIDLWTEIEEKFKRERKPKRR